MAPGHQDYRASPEKGACAVSGEKSGWRAFWRGCTWWLYKYVGGLFLEDKDGHRVISIGRCMLLSILGWMFYYWASWDAYGAVTAEELAQVVLDNLPADTTLDQYHIEFAAAQIVDAMPPTSTPPLLETAFLTACAYVFGSKVASVANKRLNGQ